MPNKLKERQGRLSWIISLLFSTKGKGILMKLLFIGDVIGRIGRDTVRKILPALKREEGIDVVIANGENSANSNGISKNSAEDLFTSGVDVITTGNHVFRRRDVYDYLDSNVPVIRPANLYPGTPGKGAYLLDMGRFQLYVVNLMGRSYMEPCDNPFLCADRLIEQAAVQNDFVDFHAEATAEKICMGQYLEEGDRCYWNAHSCADSG